MSQLGRPRALDDIKRREVCAVVATGCSLADAARYVGCAPTTLRREALRNPEFHEALRQAEMGSQLGPLRLVRKAANSHWRAAAWLLERINPERFAKPDKKTLQPAEVAQLVDSIVELMAEEIDDPATQQRIYHSLLAKAHQVTREFLAADRPRRDPRRNQKQLEQAPPKKMTNDE